MTFKFTWQDGQPEPFLKKKYNKSARGELPECKTYYVVLEIKTVIPA